MCLDTIAESNKERKDESDERARTTQVTVGVQVIACETGRSPSNASIDGIMAEDRGGCPEFDLASD